MTFPKLTVHHNHGILVLKDAEVVVDSTGYEYVRGIVIDGGVTNRLFSATSYTPFPKGEIKTWPKWGRRVSESQPGSFVMDATFCG